MSGWNTGDFKDSESILYGVIMTDIFHHTFAKTYENATLTANSKVSSGFWLIICYH